MAVWPVSLQQLANQDSFQIEIGETTIRSSMDIGPEKVRRRFTRPIDKMKISFDVDSDQYEDLLFFFNTTVNGGVTPFDYTHPITQDPISVRFTGPPAISPLGGLLFRATMEWEIML
jgi:hypothetical protein